MKTGRIKTFLTDKGFGFIVPDQQGEDVFFHETDVERAGHSIEEGAVVEYDYVVKSQKGPRARKVVIKEPTPRVATPARKESPPKRQRHRGEELPAECVFETFYVNGFRRREIYIEAAEAVSVAFHDARVTQSSVRRLFQPLKATEREARTTPDYPLAKARQCFYEFHRLVVYNSRRTTQRGLPILPAIFKDWVDAHLDTATSSVAEFVGFVEYLESILARLPGK